MTTAHVSATVLEGDPPTEAEMLAGLSWVIQRHPLLASVVRGKSKYFVPGAQPYPMHEDYLGKAVEYTEELLRTYPDADLQRFEPSPLDAAELARRALTVVDVPVPPGGDAAAAARAVAEAWRAAYELELDGLVLDEDGDGPLFRVTLYRADGASSLVYAVRPSNRRQPARTPETPHFSHRAVPPPPPNQW